MPKLTVFCCDACEQTTEHDVSQRHTPFGWKFVEIEDHIFTLCDRHASLAESQGQDVSPVLCELFAGRGINLRICKTRWNIGTGEGMPPTRRPTRTDG